jgi:hypothetical protein
LPYSAIVSPPVKVWGFSSSRRIVVKVEAVSEETKSREREKYMQTPQVVVCLCTALLLNFLLRALTLAAEWRPQSYVGEDTLEIRTTNPGEEAHWSPVWLVVINEQVYVRLGSQAAERIQKNTTAPYVGVKMAGQEFERVKGEEAPEMVEAVAKAIADKYWSDVFVRWLPHPLTLRLAPE